MSSSNLIAARVSPKTKARLIALARARQLTESAFLRRFLESAFDVIAPAAADVIEPIPQDRNTRLYVRLRFEDRLSLRERAAARGMPAATYASYLIRAHLRNVAPLPDRELTDLKASLGAISAIGRNLNQIARVANETGHVTGIAVSDLYALLRACHALRDHFRKVILANLQSWKSGLTEGEK
jgi:hypothetical protein